MTRLRFGNDPWTGQDSTYEEEQFTPEPREEGEVGCWGSFSKPPRRSYHGGSLSQWRLDCDDCGKPFFGGSEAEVRARADEHKAGK